MIPFRNFKRFFLKAVRQPVYATSVALKRIFAYGAYHWRNGESSVPEALTFFLTRACNLRCKMCGQWGDVGVRRDSGGQQFQKDWLSLEQIRNVIADVRSFRPSITLFGGEPLLHPQVIDIIREIRAQKMHSLVITNGTLLGAMAEEIVSAGLDELNISIDGPEDLHDEIRGMPGLYSKIISGIEAVNRVKGALGRSKPLINIQCTITKFNYLKLPEMLEVARRAKANSLTFHHLIFLSKELIEQQKRVDEMLFCSSRDWEGFVFEAGIDPERLDEIKRGILSAPHAFNIDFFPNFSTKGLREYYSNPEYLPSEYPSRCLSPWVCAYIFPDGEVRPCLNCSFSFGNVLHERFLRIWNSQEALRYRRALKSEGIFPACRRCTELYRY